MCLSCLRQMDILINTPKQSEMHLVTYSVWIYLLNAWIIDWMAYGHLDFRALAFKYINIFNRRPSRMITVMPVIHVDATCRRFYHRIFPAVAETAPQFDRTWRDGDAIYATGTVYITVTCEDVYPRRPTRCARLFIRSLDLYTYL